VLPKRRKSAADQAGVDSPPRDGAIQERLRRPREARLYIHGECTKVHARRRHSDGGCRDLLVPCGAQAEASNHGDGAASLPDLSAVAGGGTRLRNSSTRTRVFSE
jgi:hypothetical protein